MVLLSPPKLLMILVIALIVLGPDKLPSMARRVGAVWSEFNRWRAHVENEVRATFPDLPSTTDIARAVRSPVSILERLAEEHDATSGADPTAASSPRSSAGATTTTSPVEARLEAPVSGSSATDPPTPGPASSVSSRAHSTPRADASVGPDVSSMN